MSTPECERCGGSGKISYRTLGAIEPVHVGDGVTVQDMGGIGTRACKCVRDLPATFGTASWWKSETIYSEVVAVPIFNESVEITADCEVPRAGGGRRVHRTVENAYYPPLISFEVGRDSLTLHADTAREIAKALTAAADACDEADGLTERLTAEEAERA